jgi:putative nucleotidyltransferase with HDIG domain
MIQIAVPTGDTMSSLPLIDVDRLQLGMYVVLDVSWKDHPFAFGSFTLRTPEQLIQLRALGPRQVRYSPERSSVPPLPERRDAEPVAAEPPATAPSAASAVAAPSAPLELGPAAALRRQEASLRRVEEEYQQVARGHQQLLRKVISEPEEASQLADRLGETLYRSVAEIREPTVRLLSQRVGFQASGHEVGVAALALLLARESGFGPSSLREAALAALLHDIGKVRIPAFLHEDDGRLTGFERRSYRQHVEFGVKLANGMALSGPVIRAISEHHEHCDGSGFPAAIGADQLSVLGRVLAIVNRYQNLVCPLHFESGLTPYQALQQMYGAERAHFDPIYLTRFVRIMGVYPPGTLVELTDRRMAVVIASRPGASLSPRVQVIDLPEDDDPKLAFDLDCHSELRVRCSVLPGQLNSRWAQRSRQLARSAIYVESLVEDEQAGRPRRAGEAAAC